MTTKIPYPHMTPKTGFFILSGLLVLAGLLWAGFQVERSQQVPDMALISIRGESLNLRHLSGHPLMVSFWASDCPSCLAELDDLKALHESFAERGFKLITIAMAHDPPMRVLAFAEARKIPYTVVLDPLGKAARAFGDVALIPQHFLIDAQGNIRQQTLGKISYDTFYNAINALLQENQTCGSKQCTSSSW